MRDSNSRRFHPRGFVALRIIVDSIKDGALRPDYMRGFSPFITLPGPKIQLADAVSVLQNTKLRLYDESFSPLCRTEIPARFYQMG